jgi:hypothetical protein
MLRYGVAALLIGAPAFAATPTFFKDVLPILQRSCQSCHRAGEIGPMPFTDYRNARPWAKSIKAAVLTKKMPPWFADAKYGHFANDRRLKEEEISTLAAWADAGAPEGDMKDKPAPVDWKEGWGINPDVVFEMPQPFTVPAKGVLDYAYIVFPTGFTQDTWVTAGEIRPGARSVVHHMSAIVRPPREPWLRDAKPGVPYFPPGGAQPETDMQAGLITMNDEFLVGYSRECNRSVSTLTTRPGPTSSGRCTTPGTARLRCRIRPASVLVWLRRRRRNGFTQRW